MSQNRQGQVADLPVSNLLAILGDEEEKKCVECLILLVAGVGFEPTTFGL